MNGRTDALRVLLLVLAFLLLLSSWAFATGVLEIAPGDSIQTAIRQAPDGAVIRLLPGTHRENLQLDRGLSLLGDLEHPERVILESRLPGPVIMVSPSDNSAEVRLEGFTIRGASGFLPEGILYLTLASLHCESLIVEGCRGSGIAVSGSGSVSIQHCRVRKNDQYGIDVRTADARVTGTGNLLKDNGADLGGWAAPELRVPRNAQTASRIVRVPQNYETLQEAIDAAPPSGVILLSGGEHLGGITIWKDVTILGDSDQRAAIVPGTRNTITASILSSAARVSLHGLDLAFREQHPVPIAGTLHLDDVVCRASGAVHQDAVLQVQANGLLTAIGSKFERFGGIAIHGLPNSALQLEECTFLGNTHDVLLTRARAAHLARTTFQDSRLQSLMIDASTVALMSCQFRAVESGVGLENGTLFAIDCSFEEVLHTAVATYGTSELRLLDCAVRESGTRGLVLHDASEGHMEDCQVSGSGEAGIVVVDSATLYGTRLAIDQNLHTGLIVAGQVRVVLEDSTVKRNGQDLQTVPYVRGDMMDPILNGGIPEAPANGGGILVGMDAGLILRDVSILENQGEAGIVVDAVDPFFDFLLDYETTTDPYTHLPTVAMFDTCIEENEWLGVSVRGYGDVRMTDCLIARNRGAGIWLDSSSWTIELGPDGRSFSQTQIQTDGVYCNLKACRINENVLLGVGIQGRSTAQIESCEIRDNALGIHMQATANLDLRHSVIARSASFGIGFSPVTSEGGFTYTQPYPWQLTGYGNTIPEPEQDDGNAAGAFSDGEFPCLLSETPCEQ